MKPHTEQRMAAVAHPGVGELGRAKSYHVHDAGNEIPKGEKITFALAGNQNCGKTTLFNQLTGANQHVGNFPGVTVDRKDGTIRNHPEATVTDLPGIYSLSPYSSEEIVTRDFLMNAHPDGIINIIDATNMERNLYLTMQIMELGIPMVLVLNMMDEVRANGGSVRVNELEEILGVPVVPISAAKNEGIAELIDHAIHVARHREVPGRVDFCPASSDEHDPVGAVHRCIHAAIHTLEADAKEKGLPVRFAATKLVENDHLIAEKLCLPQEKEIAFKHLVSVMEKETGLDREAALANMRFSFIESLCEKTVVRPHESREHKRSMATRTLSSERDRRMTILLTPFMSCTAKLPIYSMMVSAFFARKYQALVMVGLYFFGIFCAVLYALILKKTKYQGEPVPFVMELPNYRLPSAKSVLQLIIEKAKGFAKKAFTIIVAASIVIWFLQTFDIRLNVAGSAEESLLAMLGGLAAPVFVPLGFGDWRISTALITGFTAKENVVSTLTVLLGGNVSLLGTLFTPFTAVVFLVFTLLYTPCVAAVATVKREMGGVKAAVITVLVQCAIAWIFAFLVHGIGMIFGLA